MLVDILQSFRVRLGASEGASAVVVGYCREACGWRWHLEWRDGSIGPWSGASYRTREIARDVGKAALRLDLEVAA